MNVRRLHLTALVAVALVAPHVARAQAPYRVALDPGTRVRVTTDSAPARRIVGSVLELRDDTLALRGKHGDSRLSLQRMRSLEVPGGKDKRRGMLIGGSIALGITAVFGGLDLAKGRISAGSLAETLVVNTAVGALVGRVFAPKGWEQIPLPTRVAFRPRDDGT